MSKNVNNDVSKDPPIEKLAVAIYRSSRKMYNVRHHGEGGE